MASGGGKPPEGWPKTGTIVYDNVTASYRSGLPAVLSDVSFSIAGGTSCGVVGRTGSGKSSLMLSLFRLIDINAGSIYLDGVETSSIGLDALRAQLAIIPQVSVTRHRSGRGTGQLNAAVRFAMSLYWRL